MHRIALSLFVMGLFTICRGGPIAYDTTSTGFSVSSYSGARCSAYLDLAGDVITVNTGNYCRALALLDESIASSENEATGLSTPGDGLSFSPGGITLSITESMDVLTVFLLGDSTDVTEVGFLTPDELSNAGAPTRIIFGYMLSIPVTIAILMAGTGLILVGRLKRRRGSRGRS
jgi:hypothetical protein